MAELGQGRTRITALVAVMVLGLLIQTDFAAALDLSRKLSGRKFSVENLFPFDGTPPCGGGTTTTVTVAFFPVANNRFAGRVTIAGDFYAANLGVCYNGSYQAVSPETTINYNIFGDWVIFRVDGRVASAAQIVRQEGQLFAISVGSNFYVSSLTDIGPSQ